MVLFKIHYSGPTPGVTKKMFNAIARSAWREVGILWHREMRPKHFTHRGAKEYGYEPRSGEPGSGKPFRGSYTFRKLRAFGHTRPLVFTGTSESLTRVRNIKATAKGARVRLHAPALNFRNPHSRIDMRQEATRISIAEANQLTKALGANIGRRLRTIRRKKTVRPG